MDSRRPRPAGCRGTGKDADILILDGHPLDFRTFVTLTMVNGKVYYEKDKSPLFDKF